MVLHRPFRACTPIPTGLVLSHTSTVLCQRPLEHGLETQFRITPRWAQPRKVQLNFLHRVLTTSALPLSACAVASGPSTLLSSTRSSFLRLPPLVITFLAFAGTARYVLNLCAHPSIPNIQSIVNFVGNCADLGILLRHFHH